MYATIARRYILVLEGQYLRGEILIIPTVTLEGVALLVKLFRYLLVSGELARIERVFDRAWQSPRAGLLVER